MDQGEMRVITDKIREIRINESTIKDYDDREEYIKKLEIDLRSLKYQKINYTNKQRASDERKERKRGDGEQFQRKTGSSNRKTKYQFYPFHVKHQM